MAGKVFSVLQSCYIVFPHHADAICLQPVSMPTCSNLEYDSNDLDPLRYFHDLPLTELTASSGEWNVTRGNPQLIAICYMIVPCARDLTWLNLQVWCSEQLLVYMLSLLPALKRLTLRLANPRALSETFFQTFVATKFNAGGPYRVGALPYLPLCLKLVGLEVDYKRWLRGPERTALLPVFGDIVSSRHSEKGFYLCLNIDVLGLTWNVKVLRHVLSILEVADYGPFVIGISSPHGVIPLVMSTGEYDPLMEVPFKEAEYLVAGEQLSIGCLSTLHQLVELRIRGGEDILRSEPHPNLPLFHTLRVLEAEIIQPLLLAGQTFDMLERCRISLRGEDIELSEGQVTQMPVCTRLDAGDPTLLATFKLPQIRELGVSFDHQKFKVGTHFHVCRQCSYAPMQHICDFL